MSKRTQSQYEYNHRNNIEEPAVTRPGQIYLKSYRQLTQQNQQLIMSIYQLRNKNEEINNKLEEKIKISKSHLEKQTPSNNLNSKQLEEKKLNREKLQNKQNVTPEKYLHNKFYRKYDQPLQPLTSTDTQQQIKISSNKNTNEQKMFTKEIKIVKQRTNSAYRIIKQNHLRCLDQIEKEETKKTEKKKATFDDDIQSTPLKNKTSEKYFAKIPQAKAPETSAVKKNQKNLVYLPITKECKQQLVEKPNKKINELKPQPPKRKPKDNSPYKVGLKRAEKQNCVYFLGSQNQENYSEQFQKIINK